MMDSEIKGLKKVFWPEFKEACEYQWRAGGKRYALGEDKEHTDLVCEVAGNIWIGGNIIKYAGEIDNELKTDYQEGKAQEVNFFKIAVYAYIWWLKEFKHPTTGVGLKEKYWLEFISSCWEVIGDVEIGGIIDAYAFIDLVKIIKKFEIKVQHPFFLIVAFAYNWWLRNRAKFTDKEDLGEKFRK